MPKLEAFAIFFLKDVLEYFLSYVIVTFILCYLRFDNKVENREPRILPSRETIRMTSILSFWGFFALFLLAVIIIE